MEVILCLDQLGHLAQNDPSFSGFCQAKILARKNQGLVALASCRQIQIMSISRAFQDSSFSMSALIVLLLQWLNMSLSSD